MVSLPLNVLLLSVRRGEIVGVINMKGNRQSSREDQLWNQRAEDQKQEDNQKTRGARRFVNDVEILNEHLLDLIKTVASFNI